MHFKCQSDMIFIWKLRKKIDVDLFWFLTVLHCTTMNYLFKVIGQWLLPWSSSIFFFKTLHLNEGVASYGDKFYSNQTYYNTHYLLFSWSTCAILITQHRLICIIGLVFLHSNLFKICSSSHQCIRIGKSNRTISDCVIVH